MKLLAASLIGVLAISGCASQADQQAAAQAEAAAARAEESAAHAEQAATQALDAANKATEAANRATKAVEDATAEINRVSDHMDQMEKDREAATHGRRLSHVTNAARRASTGRAPNPEASPSPGAATPTK
jgi:methyl-accepting chemotaxis protein